MYVYGSLGVTERTGLVMQDAEKIIYFYKSFWFNPLCPFVGRSVRWSIGWFVGRRLMGLSKFPKKAS